MSDINYLTKIRAQREVMLQIPDKPKAKIKLRRPPILWMGNWRREGSNDMQLLLEAVVGWEGVTEADLLGDSQGSSEVEVDFNLMVAVEWLADNPEYASAVAVALQENLRDRVSRKEEHTKN